MKKGKSIKKIIVPDNDEVRGIFEELKLLGTPGLASIVQNGNAELTEAGVREWVGLARRSRLDKESIRRVLACMDAEWVLEPISQEEKKVETRVATKTETKTGQVTIAVETSSSKGESEVTRQPLASKEICADDCTKVSYQVGITKSLGNYEFIRIDIGFEDYCERGKRADAVLGLRREADQLLEHMVGEMWRLKQRASGAGSLLMEDKPQEDTQPARSETKLVLNEELQMAAQAGKLDYGGAVAKLKASPLSESEAKRIIRQLRDGDYRHFLDPRGDQEERDAIDSTIQGEPG